VRLGRRGEGEEPTWAGAEKRALGFGPTGEGTAWKRNGPRGGNDHSQKQRKENGDLFFLLLFFSNFSKAIQNEILTQFEIRLQTKQYKILCNSMNAHSLLLNLYLVLFLIKLLFPNFKCPQNT